MRTAPFFAIAAGMSILTIIEQHGHIARTATTEWKLGMLQRLIVAGKAAWFYAAKIVWPASLTFVYPRWSLDTASALSWIPVAGLVLAGRLLWKSRRHPSARAGLFAGGYFLAALLPVLGFIDVFYFRYSFVADHFQYLASLGIIAGLTNGLASALDGEKLSSSVVKNTVFAGLLLNLAALSWIHCLAFHDPETLWRDTLTKNPESWMVHSNLGNTLSASGKLDEAIEQYEEELRLMPDHADAHYNIANTLTRQGHLPQAIAEYKAALRINPRDAESHYNEARTLDTLGRTQEAIEEYKQALEIKPDFANAHYNLGNALIRQGHVPQAIAQYKETLQIDPEDPAAHYNLGVALEMSEKIPEAVLQYQSTLRLAPDFTPAKAALTRLQTAN